MNATTSQTNISITTTIRTTSAIKKVTVYNYRGKAKQIEKLRAIQI